MKTINLTDKQYQALINGGSVTITLPTKKATKWEPQEGAWYIDLAGCVSRYNANITENIKNFGVTYQTEEQAEWARDKMRTHNRLLAWLAENDDGWREDWREDNNGNWGVDYSFVDKEYTTYDYSYTKDLIGIFMSEENANKLCKLLNSGEVVL